jgi:Mlc titration factor MtfA (ptsG expression regulator)
MFDSIRQHFSRTPPVFDDLWRAILEADFEHWLTLSDTEIERIETLVASFYYSTRWEAANGFELNDEIKVLISAQASMLLLGLELDNYPQLTSVIVHPSTVRLRGGYNMGGGVRSTEVPPLLGQAHFRGPVLLSWNAALRGAKNPAAGQNVVYHEFAHRLDMLDGVTDGTPPLDDEEARLRWVRVCTEAYDTVRAEGSEVLRPYAGTNPAEFFAVATEVFFNRPVAVRQHEPELYEELRAFYHQDPAQRIGI